MRVSLLVMFLVLVVTGITLTAKPKPAEKAPAADPSRPPSDAQFTLYCQAIAGPAHAAVSALPAFALPDAIPAFASRRRE